jgi:hypothetical protein
MLLMWGQTLESSYWIWHRMRANVYMQLGDHVAGRKELETAIKYSRDVRLFILYLLGKLPGPAAGAVLKIIKKIRYLLTS